MKKHLLAIAVASAVAVPAMAQVSISGRIDTSVGRYEDSAGKSTTKIDSDFVTTNQIIISGSEDLGGGLKASFSIVSPFASDANSTFNFGGRGATLSLSGGFGTIDLGRSPGNLSNSMMASSVVGNIGNLGTVRARPDNSINYSSPNMGGFTVRVLHSLGGETDPNTGEQTEISLQYSAGPLLVRLARNDYDLVGSFGNGDETQAQLDYNLGFAKLNARYRKQSSDTSAAQSLKRYGVGVSVPLGSGLTGVADYQDWDNNTTVNSDKTVMAFGLIKTLSKRTNVYGMFVMENQENATLKDGDTIAVGVRHNF
jgi:predicted porin